MLGVVVSWVISPHAGEGVSIPELGLAAGGLPQQDICPQRRTWGGGWSRSVVTGTPGSASLCGRGRPGFRLGEGTARGAEQVPYHIRFSPLLLFTVIPWLGLGFRILLVLEGSSWALGRESDLWLVHPRR